MAAIRAFLIELGVPLLSALIACVHIVAHGSSEPIWFVGLFLVGGIALVLEVVRRVRAFFSEFDSDAPYVTMDSAGLVCSLPSRRFLPWSQIEGCACKNEHYRTILRVFVKGTRQWPMEIDFALAAQPKRSLDQALVACAAWIVATRDPSVTDSPIREFIEKRPSRWSSQPGKPVDKTFLVVLIAVLLVAVVLLSATALQSL